MSDIRYLRLLRAMIHNEVMFVDSAAREEGQNPALFRKYIIMDISANHLNHIYLQTI